ncbi:MAG: SDR family oxidoreductase [Chitinophagaceae bacterium]
MDIKVKNQLFLVCGASSGFGRAVAEGLALEGAHVIAIARREELLQELVVKYPGQIDALCCDVTQQKGVEQIVMAVNNRQLHGMLINAGGPPAMKVLETTLEDWDNAYKTVLRWKIDLLQKLLPSMINLKYGRIVFIESASVKQPMENLVLSNSMRLAAVGFVKSMSLEIAANGITLNVLAPGFHSTAAMERIFTKKIDQMGITREEALHQFVSQTSVGFMGDPVDLASLATWLLSPQSRFITGQTISVDGGAVKGIMG